MKESQFITDDEDVINTFAIKEVFLKYLPYWPWFLVSALFSLFMGYLFLRYAPVTYASTAKIKVIGESKEMDITTNPMALLKGTTQINLDNEIEILKSYRLLSQVVNELNLDISFYNVGTIKSSEIWDPPFVITKNISLESLKNPMSYDIKLHAEGIVVTDAADNEFNIALHQPNANVSGLPFNIFVLEDTDVSYFKKFDYRITLNPTKNAVLQLIQDLYVVATNRKSEILSLSMTGESLERSEAILNTTIDIFNEDGILDRQLVSKRTVDFIDERFMYLSEELDSIESGKQDFKQENNLSYIEEDASITLKNKSENQQDVFNLQTQVSISKMLKETIENEKAFSLLPSDIGLENSSVNNLVSEYNRLVLEREKLMTTVGVNHPTLRVLNGQLERGKQNILNTVGIYLKQQQMSLRQRSAEMELSGSTFSRLPEKEKMLRAIERQQSIKENLFLLLLQKREEAAINLAVTAPSVKVVDYGLTSNEPVSPKRSIVLPVALLLGLCVPFAALFISSYLDTKVHDRSDLEKINPEIPVLVEIPILGEGKMMQAHDRSSVAESFRILVTNIKYHLSQKTTESKGQVVLVTSTIKGEGKTVIAVNSSLAYASLNKKVLLVGADLRNPQLHNYVYHDNNSNGLSDYLNGPSSMDWRDCLKTFGNNPRHQVLLSGPAPSNPPQLLSNHLFSKFLDEAKSEFDYIVVDTAPTLLVTDTLIISQNADITLFVTRANFTEKRLLEFSKDLYKAKKLKNMTYVVNSVDHDASKGYNYGYGYGYDEDVNEAPWYTEFIELGRSGLKKLFKKRMGSR